MVRFRLSHFIAVFAGAFTICADAALADGGRGLSSSFIDRSHSNGLYSTGYRGTARTYQPAHVAPSGCGTVYGHSTYHHAFGYPYNGYFPTRYDITPFSRTHLRPRAYYRYFYQPYQRPASGDAYFRMPNIRAHGMGITVPLNPPMPWQYIDENATPNNMTQPQSPQAMPMREPVQMVPHAPKLLMPPQDPAEITPFDELPPAPRPDDAGWDLLVRGDISAAINEFIEETSMQPGHATPRVGFALCAAFQNDDDAAIWAMKRAFSIDSETLLRFAGSEDVNDEIRGLMSRYLARISTDESDNEAQFMVAALHFLLGENDASGTSIDTVLASGDGQNASRQLRNAVNTRLAVAAMRLEQDAETVRLAAD
jgi:hypothetical protein